MNEPGLRLEKWPNVKIDFFFPLSLSLCLLKLWREGEDSAFRALAPNMGTFDRLSRRMCRNIRRRHRRCYFHHRYCFHVG
jgi:hypothetical protein